MIVTAVGGGIWLFKGSGSSSGVPNISPDLLQAQTGPQITVNEDVLDALDEQATQQLITTTSNQGWVGFRGPFRTGVVPDQKLNADWSTNPPVELWRKPSGEGWSSVAISGNRIFGHEQRGPDETVFCLDRATGKEIWSHGNKARMPDGENGVGPRATPTTDGKTVVTVGATGIVNALNAENGDVIWTVNIAEKLGGVVPREGVCSSPLLTDDGVVVFVPRCKNGGVCSLNLETGDLNWQSGKGLMSNSSPIMAEFAGQSQLLFASDVGVESFDPNTGQELWTYLSDSDNSARYLEPCVLSDNSFLLLTGLDLGFERVVVTKSESIWTTKQAWHSNDFQCYLHGVFIHDGFLYSVEDRINVGVELKTGIQKWKGGRSGGQSLLFPSSGHILTLSKSGDLVVQTVDSQRFVEAAKFPAIEGKCLGHPAYFDGHLVVRNENEIACFKLNVAPKPND